MKRIIAIAAFAASLLLFAGLTSAQSNPFVGPWKLNVARSKFNPGPPPKSQTRLWESSGKVSIEGIDATGKHTSLGYTIKTDGKDYPITGSILNGAETVSSTRVNPNAVETSFKKAGTEIETMSFVLSNHGKVLTIEAKGTLPSGKPFDNIQVWDKQ